MKYQYNVPYYESEPSSRAEDCALAVRTTGRRDTFSGGMELLVRHNYTNNYTVHGGVPKLSTPLHQL